MKKGLMIAGVLGLAGVAGAQDEYRSFDGWGNNLSHPDWGQAVSQMLRGPSGAHYADGIGEMVERENPRVSSNLISAQTRPSGNARGLSSMAWLWGQFVDHDLSLTVPHPNQFDPIIPPADDPVFGPGDIIPFSRTIFEEGRDTPRQHANVISHFLDGSQIYSSDLSRGFFLREMTGGRMKLDENGFLPRNENGDWNNANDGNFPDDELFLAGDVRANENPGLAIMHTVWVREHNRWADRLSAENPSWDDERLYQMARKIVGAELARVTYSEWLPAMLGGDGIGPYQGYDDTINPSIANSFSAATFRFGHTMVGEFLERYNEDGSVFGGGHLSLRESFFNPEPVTEPGSLEAILRGFSRQEAEEIDTQVVDSLRNFLFDNKGGGLDLVAVNIKRGRDHGIPDYNTLRVELGLDPVASFDEITSDPGLADALELLYGDVNDIDAWVGMLSEDHLPGAAGGELFVAALTDQFMRLREGDRFFYLNDPMLEPYLSEIERTSLADILNINAGLNLTGNVFFVPSPAGVALLLGGGLLAARRRRQDA